MQDLTPQEIIARDRSRLAAALQTGVVQNPDEEAGLRREAQQRGMDPEVLRTAKAQKTPLPPPALSTWYDMPERAPRAAGFLSNPQNAAIAHDDTDNLSLAEQTMDVLKGIGGSLYAGLPRTSAGIVGFFEGAEDVSDAVLGAPFRGIERLLGTNVGERNRQFTRQQRGDYRRYLLESAAASRPQTDNKIAQAAYSGVESIVPSALGVLTGLVAGPGAGAAVIAAPTGGEAYGRARDQGKAIAPALAYGGAQGSAEFLGERIGLGPLLEGLKMGSPFLQTFVKTQIAEQVGEQATTVLQDFTDYAMLNPDQTFTEFLAERPDAALQTAVATAVGSGATTTGAYAVQATAQRLDRNDRQRRAAMRDNNLVQQLNAVAGASKVRARSPETFEEFVGELAQDGPVDTLYVDAQTFNQTLEDAGISVADVEAAVPAVAEQLTNALRDGGDLAIPVEQFAARISGTDFAQPLLDHLRVNPALPSRAEVMALGQDANEALQAEVEAVLTAEVTTDAFRQSAERVKASLAEQLNTAGRFTKDVNDAYASLPAAYYTVRAAQLGITPEEMAARYPLQIRAELPTAAGQATLDQGRLPSSNSLALPDAPTPEVMERASRVERVPLSAARSTQSEMDFERFDRGDSPGPVVPGYEDKPVAVRREDGEYLIFDGHHRAVRAAEAGNADMEMYVVDAKDYAPELAGRAPAQNRDDIDALLAELGAEFNQSEAPAAPPFYSALARAVAESKTAKAPAAQWKATLAKTPGVKAEELEWSGVNEWLDLQEGAVERQTLQDFLEVGGIELEEAVLGGQGIITTSVFASPVVERALAGAQTREDAIMQLENDGPAYAMLSRRESLQDAETGELFEDWAELVVDDVWQDASTADGAAGPAQYSNYKLPGADDTYREFLIRLPNLRGDSFSSAERHFDQFTDVIGHARFTTRTDAEGAKVLFLEEVQSTHHEAGREEGYARTATDAERLAANIAYDAAVAEEQRSRQAMLDAVLSMSESDVPPAERSAFEAALDTSRPLRIRAGAAYSVAAARDLNETAAAIVDPATGPYVRAQLAVREAVNAIDALSEDGVARAPWEKSWSQLVMKRMIRYAVDNGYDKVAWINGNQQNGGQTGGDGAWFYERNLVNETNAILKKLGARVEKIDFRDQGEATYSERQSRAISRLNAGEDIGIPTQAEIMEIRARPAGALGLQNGFVLTDKIKAQAAEGFSLFQRNRGQIAFSGDITQSPSVISLLRTADLSTFLHETGHYFLEVDAHIASQPDAPAEVVADVERLLSWFGVTGSSARDGAVNSVPSRLEFDAKALADLAVGEPGAAQADSLISAEPFLGVFDGVVDAVRDFQVLQTVIASLPVDVVDVFRGQELTPEMALQDPAVLKELFSQNGANGVAFTVDGARALSALLRVVASRAAESPRAAKMAGVADDSGSAMGANGADQNSNPSERQERTPLDVWNAMGVEEKRRFHEQFARGFEAFLLEGRAPTPELQTLFQRFRSWLLNVYKSLTSLNVELTDEVRDVMGRMLASAEAIQNAEDVRHFKPLAETRPPYMTEQAWDEYQRAFAAATAEGLDTLSTRTVRDMKWLANARSKALKRLQAQANDARRQVRAEVTAEVNAEPINRARRFITRGTDENNEPIPGAGKLDLATLREMYGEGEDALWRQLRRGGKYGEAGNDGIHPDVVAENFGFASGDALVRALISAENAQDKIAGLTDQRMLERYGDIADEQAMDRATDEAIANDARARVLATEYAALAEATGQPRALAAAARQYAAGIVNRIELKRLKPHQFFAASARAGRQADAALKKDDLGAAATAKRNQLVNMQAARYTLDAKREVDQALTLYKRIIGANDEALAKSRDMALVNATRALLAQYGLTRMKNDPMGYLERVKAYDPQLYADIEVFLKMGPANVKPFADMTFEEFQGMHDVVRQLWALSRRTRQIEIDGKLVDLELARKELGARLDELGYPNNAAGNTRAPTDAEKRGRLLQGARASLRRVESWTRGLDGDSAGVFRRYIWNPVSSGADRYRSAQGVYLQRFLDLVKPIEADLARKAKIEAAEIGYTFNSKAELLHAILHSGNQSNLSKLLLGRRWGGKTADGSLDTTQWDAFLSRMWAEGKLTKADYDFAQSVWDLLDELKPAAQEAHRQMYGRYFDEITADEISTPFGVYRGGYVPATTDAFMVQDAALRAEQEAIEDSNSAMFPAASNGFTKSRVEDYTRELALDVRLLPMHIDKVLKFTYIGPPVRDVARLLKGRDFSAKLQAFDPVAQSDLLLPWLQRAAKQIVQTPTAGAAGKMVDTFFREMRSRTGMQLMFANLSNTAQQVTGFSNLALRVKKRNLQSAMWKYFRNPKGTAEAVTGLSSFMATRTTSQVFEARQTIEQMLLNPNKYEKLRDFSSRHAYFFQTAAQNFTDIIGWSAAYDQAVAQGLDDAEAVRFADSVIRETQGSMAPEDVSRAETGPAFMRMFTQFWSYFNNQANLLGTEFQQVARGVGVRKGAGRLFYIYLMGYAVPALMADAIAIMFRGGLDDDEDDGYLDELLQWFFMGQVKFGLAAVPVVGQVTNAAIGAFTDVPYDDRVSVSPAVSVIESGARLPAEVYQTIVEGESFNRRDTRDLMNMLGIISGTPIGALGRPVSYGVGVAQGDIEPTGPVDFTRGLVTGAPSPESRTNN